VRKKQNGGTLISIPWGREGQERSQGGKGRRGIRHFRGGYQAARRERKKGEGKMGASISKREKRNQKEEGAPPPKDVRGEKEKNDCYLLTGGESSCRRKGDSGQTANTKGNSGKTGGYSSLIVNKLPEGKKGSKSMEGGGARASQQAWQTKKEREREASSFQKGATQGYFEDGRGGYGFRRKRCRGGGEVEK